MNFWFLVNRIIDESDIVLQVLDARMIEESRNSEIEKKVIRKGRILIYVINKIDLVKKIEKTPLYPSALISSKERLGATRLKKLLLRYAGDKKMTVGVLGYPNTGKSSVINALKGRKAAGTSSVAGYTKGLQRIRIHKNLLLIDTPGVIPFMEKDAYKHAKIGTRSADQIKDVQEMAFKFIEDKRKTIEGSYKIKLPKDPEEALEALAMKMNLLIKGGKPDLERVSRRLIDDWQKGKLV